MSDLLTAAQMRALEQAAIESGDVSGLELMERAGRGVVEAVFEAWPELAEAGGAGPQSDGEVSEQKIRKAVVLCGPGNNGGDGYVIARLLRECGWQVEAFAFGDPDRLPPDAQENHRRWTKGGGVVLPAAELRPDTWGRPPELFIDALFGTGLARPLDPVTVARPLADVQAWKERTGADTKFVAVDIPSGLCADSGRDLGVGCFYDLTVTFHTAKPGHYLGEGAARCGRVKVVDIGLPPDAARRRFGTGVVRLLDRVTAPGKRTGHKYDHGHALVLAGGPGKGGAARLAARGALRIGAGLVTLGCPPEALPENAAQVTAIMLEPVADAAELARLLADPRKNALCIGPGFGTGAREAAMLAKVLDSGRPTVLDADALTLHARDKALVERVHENCVLTPHAGEFARLFPDIHAALTDPATTGPAYSKADAARDAAKQAGCTVLFKGVETVIAGPDGRCAIHAAHGPNAVPWLATAGSGDVLAGMIAGLLARGISPPADAAAIAVVMHAQAARHFGPGLIAEDLPEQLPLVLRQLEA